MSAASPLNVDPVQAARADRQARVLPALTAAGFDVVPMPPALFADLRDWLHAHLAEREREEGVDYVVRGDGSAAPSELVRLDHTSALARRVFDEMQPLLETWCQHPLVPASIYGARIYRRGATLDRHVDHPGTHVASAVLQLDQAVEAPWPLMLEQRGGHRDAVSLEPGQALLYEGARLPHYRAQPLCGASYAAVFVHYRPRWWSYTPKRVEALDATPPLPSLAYGRPERVQAPSAGHSGYLAFQPDYGGWNNVLMQLEIMVGLAWLTGRTLVLPPAKTHYLLGEEQHGLGAFLDLEVLAAHVPTLSADAFAERLGVPAFESYEAFSACCAQRGVAPRWNALDDALVHPSDAVAQRPELAARLNARRAVALADERLASADLLYFPMTVEHRMFGVAEAFFVLGDQEHERSVRRLLRDAIRYRPELIARAERALHSPLLGRGFGAMHVRRGDFQYGETQVSAEAIVAHTRALYEPGATIYLATDHDQRAFFDPLREHFHVVTARDLALHDVAGHWLGIVETLICAGAPGPFAGTRLSTFSSRIAILRGHLAATRAGRAAGLDATIYFTQPPLHGDGGQVRPYAGPGDDQGETALPWWESMRQVPLWGRAYEATWGEIEHNTAEVSVEDVPDE